jgi:multiple sugar transport system permease protein
MQRSDLRTNQTTMMIKDLTPARKSQTSALVRWRFWQRHVGIPYLFLLPFLALFVVFFLLPLGYALDISLFNERLVGGTIFVGLANYLKAFGDGNFWSGLRNVVLLLLVQVPVMLIFALALALLLTSQIVRWKTLFRLGYFLPYAIPSVIGALLWGYLYSSHIGPFGPIASALHLPAPAFLTESGLLPSIGNMLIWQWTGYNMIVMYAALQAIPLELYDAARVDGANGWNVARYIKIPLIIPAIIVTAIFSIIGTLQLFNEPQIMFAIVPQIVQDHYTPNMYAYNLAFTNQEYNYSAAVSFVLGGAVFVFSYIFMLASNRRSREGSLWQR